MRVLTWNIQHGGDNHPALAAALIGHDPDVIVLSEHQNDKSAPLVAELRDAGWRSAAASPTDGRRNGVALLSKNPILPAAAPFGEPPNAWWGVESTIGDLSIIGIYAPLAKSWGSSPEIQRQFWDALHRVAETRSSERLLMIGDFNTCSPIVDGGPNPQPCWDAFEQLPTLGWVDAWRTLHPDGRDFSWVQRQIEPNTFWRIDHAFVTSILAPAIPFVHLFTRRARGGTVRPFDPYSGARLRLMGVDGCKTGWVVAEAPDGALSDVRFWIAATAQEVVERLTEDTLAIIDIPIGLPLDRPRACDLQARQMLSPYTSRVFPAPSRAALGATEYRSCCQLNQEAVGKGLSKQSHALLPKIREVDELMSPEVQSRVREGHPEVTFRVLSGTGLKFGKQTVAGAIERMEILKRHGLVIDLSEASTLGRISAGLDDVLDAAACLVTARRVVLGLAAPPLGEGCCDAMGLPMEIVA